MFFFSLPSRTYLVSINSWSYGSCEVDNTTYTTYRMQYFGQFPSLIMLLLFLLMTVHGGTEEADTEEMNMGINFSIAAATSIMLIAGVVVIVLAVIVYLSIIRCKKNNAAMVSYEIIFCS